MNELLKKMNYKNQQRLLVLNAPEEFHPHLQAFREAAEVDETIGQSERKLYGFVLVFAKNSRDVMAMAPEAVKRCEPGGLLWFAYPKKTSKKYKADISRDEGWQPLKELGFEGVRLIAIDDDWSAMRFRSARQDL
ncbi:MULTISPECIES: hypothetical protein [Paenibacillus]|uniref:Uncharacterized protein n=1 Tax=Paenibacillus naphthalenovorans TaxID=162209 RepID=A0A0U2UC53_9BACL|nr:MULTISPECIES: hypothetical protein [Paenibacillus]ALS20764.1 hypothetical protein IJ22_03750 [Paenibacillus naphthalenovorans]GCL70793.1 hypothetical protein PN4B1_06950 [Paenibacillus naphthalenovorans]